MSVQSSHALIDNFANTQYIVPSVQEYLQSAVFIESKTEYFPPRLLSTKEASEVHEAGLQAQHSRIGNNAKRTKDK